MTVSKQIIEVLDALCEKFGIVIDWASENVLPQLQDLGARFIKYNIITDCIWCFVGLILVIIAGLLLGKFIKDYIIVKTDKKAKTFTWSHDYNGSPMLEPMVAVVIPLIVLLFGIGLPAFCCSISDLIKDICLPEVVIFEYVKGLM